MKRTLILAAALLAALTGAQAQAPAPAPAKTITFAVSTVKPSKSTDTGTRFFVTPSGLTIENLTLESVVRFAYHLQDDQLLNVPAWAKSTHYNIEAKVDDDDREAFKKLTFPQRIVMVQTLLIDRFHLKTHPDTRDLPIFNLVVAKSGLKIKPTETAPDEKKNHGIMSEHGALHANDCPMDIFTQVLAQVTHHLVVDKTGLTAHYDFTLQYTDENATADPGNTAPSIYTALQEQLGLKLDSAKAPMPVLVVDRIDQPTAD